MLPTIACPPCDGTGRRPRLRRLAGDGSPDPLDTLGRFPELCDRCGGSGRIAETPREPRRTQPGRAADI